MSDMISRQAAIDAFEKFIHELGIEDEPYNYGEMALSAKNVLSVIPQPKYEDIAKAFQFGLAFGFGEKYDEMDRVIDEIKKVIIPQPERKKGAWTNDASCPFCLFQPWYERDIHTLSFCPNCGADMRKEGEE